MKILLFIIKKEFLSLWRDRAGLIAIMIVPMLGLIIFNQVISTDMRHVVVEAVVEKPSQRANEFLKPLRENDIFVYNGTTTSVAEGMKLFRQNKVHALVVLSKDFDKQIDAPKSLTTKGAQNPAVQIITDNSNTIIGTTANYYIQSTLNPQSTDYINLKMLYNPSLNSVYQFGVGVFALFLILQSVFWSASSMVKEKERHSVDSIIISSINTRQLMMGKMLTYLFMNCILAMFAISVTHFFLGLPLNGPLWVFALLTIICILTTMFLGTYISLCSATEANALNTTILVVCMPILNFSGVIFPVECMPDWTQCFGDVIYARWYIDAMRKIMLQGVDFTYVIKETCLILLNMFIFLMLCIYKLKNDRWLK